MLTNIATMATAPARTHAHTTKDSPRQRQERRIAEKMISVCQSQVDTTMRLRARLLVMQADSATPGRRKTKNALRVSSCLSRRQTDYLYKRIIQKIHYVDVGRNGQANPPRSKQLFLETQLVVDTTRLSQVLTLDSANDEGTRRLRRRGSSLQLACRSGCPCVPSQACKARRYGSFAPLWPSLVCQPSSLDLGGSNNQPTTRGRTA
jgi:hypothetical protein